LVRILHFADAHIDMANYGRYDPETGLPIRVMDFLKSLDTIVQTAIDEKVDLVLFAGDAFKDRSPAPTFQREWGRRIMRLARSAVCTASFSSSEATVSASVAGSFFSSVARTTVAGSACTIGAQNMPIAHSAQSAVAPNLR